LKKSSEGRVAKLTGGTTSEMGKEQRRSIEGIEKVNIQNEFRI
jgi:hypothetical protein